MWDKWFRTGCALLVSGTLLFGSGFSPAVAEEEPPRTKRTQTISQDAYRRLNRVQELADAGEVDSALQLLERVQERASNDYEAAMALNLKAYIHYGQEQYDAAASAYASILAMQAVPESLRRNTLFSLAKIRFIQEDYAAALVPLRAWFEQTEEPGIDALLLLGQAHYQLGQYDKVVPPVRAAIELAEAQGREPRENWYLLLRAAHYQQNDFVAMRDVLRTLLEINPKREYFTGTPWASNRAVEVLSEAAGMSDDGNLYVQLAQIELDLQHWEAADVAAGKALLKGGLRRPELPYVLQGLARYNAENYRGATQAFQQAQSHDASEKLASQWLKFIDQEQARSAALQAASNS